jgi:ribosomal protein S18 acetylase RimI-like enzyme
MEYRIRRVEATDAPVVRMVRLRSLSTDPESFASTHEREAAYGDSDWDDWAQGHASGNETATFLAMNEPNAVGIVAAYRDETEPRTFHVFAMWVAPEVRRERIGRGLLQTVESWIASSGGNCVQLSVADRADAARRLYERAGYLPDGAASDSPHTPGITYVSLRRILPRSK